MNLPYQATITGTGTCLPKKLITNEELFTQINNFEEEQARLSLTRKGYDLSGKSDAQIFDLWVQQVCGIKSRPFVSEEDDFHEAAAEKHLQVEYLALAAAKQALAVSERYGVTKEDLDQVIFSTYSSNRIMPSAGVTLTHLLDLPETTHASAVTVNGACSGFLDALIDAVIKVRSGAYRHILVVAAEQLSNKMNYDDPKTAIIFSDGAGAMVVSRNEGLPSPIKENIIRGHASGVQYSEQVYMERRGDIFFNSGPLVERNAVRTMKNISERVLKSCAMTLEDIDYIVPHQANLRILMSFQKETGFPEGNILKKIETLGNLSSASVPVTLDTFLKNPAQKTITTPKNFLLISVGGGYTFSSLIVPLTPSVFHT